MARDILTIPLLRSRHNALSPLLQSLSREDGAGLLLALRGMAGNTAHCQGVDQLQDKFLQKVHFLNNYCTCALSLTPDGHVFQDGLRMLITSSVEVASSTSRSSTNISSSAVMSTATGCEVIGTHDNGKKRGGSWIESVCDTLFALPLVMILNRISGVVVPDHSLFALEVKSSDVVVGDGLNVGDGDAM